MKKLTKVTLVCLGIAMGLFISLLMKRIFAIRPEMLDYLMIINCAFFITLLAERDELSMFQPVAYLFWLMLLSPCICMYTADFTMNGIWKGISFSLMNRSLADCFLRLVLRLGYVRHHLKDERTTRLIFHDNLFKRFFHISLLKLLHLNDGE